MKSPNRIGFTKAYYAYSAKAFFNKLVITFYETTYLSY